MIHARGRRAAITAFVSVDTYKVTSFNAKMMNTFALEAKQTTLLGIRRKRWI